MPSRMGLHDTAATMYSNPVSSTYHGTASSRTCKKIMKTCPGAIAVRYDITTSWHHQASLMIDMMPIIWNELTPSAEENVWCPHTVEINDNFLKMAKRVFWPALECSWKLVRKGGGGGVNGFSMPSGSCIGAFKIGYRWESWGGQFVDKEWF